MSAPTSVTRAERITNLDTVRGVATLGILVMNAVSFALPEAAYFNLDADGSHTWLDWVIGVAGEIFIDQKTMALFSLLFGVGIVVFAERAEAKGHGAVKLSLWRNLLLLAIGILHSLVWDGDILSVYAVCSIVLLAVWKRSPRALFVIGCGLVLSSALLAALAQTQIDSTGDGLGTYWFVDGEPIGDAAGLFLISDFFLRSLGMMLVGVALYRFEIVQGQRPASYYRRMAMLGLSIGLPVAATGVALQFAFDWKPEIALIGEAPNTLATIPMAFGYLGLLTLWNQRQETAVHRRVRAVGRMALTNYLAHTALGITLFRLVLDRGDASRSGIALFIVCVWAAQLWWSQLWLARHRFGPFEWAWRCATYRTRQPLRRQPATTPTTPTTPTTAKSEALNPN